MEETNTQRPSMGKPPRLGLFCLYENLVHDFARTMLDEVRMVQHAEALGFAQAWLPEHHFNADSVSPSILALLAHLAGVTHRIRLGTAAVLLPFHDPIQVAEDVATVDVLSGGRVNFGVARGGPFPDQNRHFRAEAQDSRERTLEALDLIERLLYEDTVHHSGRWFHAEGVRLTPRPVQQRIPTWIATTTQEAVVHAARHGHGLMGALPSPLQRLAQVTEWYREAAPGADARLVVLRFAFVADSREEALAHAEPFVRGFIDRKKALFARHGLSAPPDFETAAVLERSLIGTPAQIRERVAQLQALGMRSLALVPASESFEQRQRCLTDFAHRVWA